MSKFYTHVACKGGKILHRGWDDDGRRIHESVPFRPSLFVRDSKSSDPPKYKTINGMALREIDFPNQYDMREFMDEYGKYEGFTIYGEIDSQYQFIAKEYRGDSEVDYNPNHIRVMYIDIEVESENGFASPEDPTERVNVITIRMSDGKGYTLALHDFDVSGVKCFSFDDDERALLSHFVDLWESLDTDIVSGWNVNAFDMPYLYNRITALLGKKTAQKLSPWNIVRDRKVTDQNRTYTVYEFTGITILDYIELYKKFTFVKQESYRLGFIASTELGEDKIAYDDIGTITDFYRRDFQRFVEYNVRDVDLVVGLENKLRLIELALGLAYSSRTNYGDVFTQVRMWDSIIYNYLLQRNTIIPPRKKSDKDEQFEGAYVKDPQVGQHDWVVSFDLDSLYPHLIMQYNISPETKTDKSFLFLRGNLNPDMILDNTDKVEDQSRSASENGVSICANGVAFTNEFRGFLPELMDTMYEQRKQFKKKMLELKAFLKNNPDLSADEVDEKKREIAKYGNFQLVRKVQLNSAYGALGNQYCRYYDLEMAEAITVSGQLSARWIEKQLNEFLNKVCETVGVDYVIASDTDSVYLRMSELVNKMSPNKSQEKTVDFIDKSCKSIILPFIAKKYDELAKRMNAYANKMSMKRESIAAKGIWTAKKRYALTVLKGEDDVYMDTPELKITGLEMVKSSTPAIVRKRLKEAMEIVMLKDESNLRRFVQDFHAEFIRLPADKVAFPRGCNGLDTYGDYSSIYKKATPIAPKGALIYNHWIRMKKLGKKYPMIREGEKIKYLYLRMPNPINEKVISFVTSLPEELSLDKHIDYEMQFEKSFVQPLTAIVEIIGWKLEETSSLEDLFV
jgi:DNA polymerase elongation subunit (family B)